MKAIVQDTYGSADVLRLADIDKPIAGDHDLLVRVRAAGVDPSVWHLMMGLPYMIRLMGLGFSSPKARVRGADFAGNVEAVGKSVAHFKPGDEVFGVVDFLKNGSFAEYASAPEGLCAPKPSNLTFEQAAAVPLSACTALQGLSDRGKIQSGRKVLVVGAAGGVGSYAVQLAKAFGAEVTGVCGTDKLDLVRSLGASDVIDYSRSDFTDGSRRWDLILDTAGRRPLSLVRRALTPHGILVIVGGEGGNRWTGGFIERQLHAAFLSTLGSQKLVGLSAKANQKDLLTLKELIEAGKVVPVVDRTYPLAEAAEAIRRLEHGHARGKAVITL